MNNFSASRARILLLLAFAIAALVAAGLLPPVPQPPGYYGFADRRELLGIPNFWNVISNLPFLLVGASGIRELSRCGSCEPASRVAYRTFFVGAVLIALGSACFHWAPSNETLVCDRLPMTVAFMAFVSIVVGEHLDRHWGERALVPSLLLGAASVLYWYATERAGHGDLRPYLLVQFAPVYLLPLVLWLFPSRSGRAPYLWGTLGAYCAAKILEAADAQIFALGQWLSGHTLKHLTAALGMYLVVLAIRHRTHGAAEATPVRADVRSLAKSSI